jgi:hypothetical protein
MVVSVAALQLPVTRLLSPTYEASHDVRVTSCFRPFSSKPIIPLCQLPWVGMSIWAGHYKVKIKRHNFLNDLLMCQYTHLPLCGPLPGCFAHQPISLPTPPRNRDSHKTSHNTIYYSLVVKWTASTPNPFKVNAVTNGSCDMLLHWIQVGHFCHHRLH